MSAPAAAPPAPAPVEPSELRARVLTLLDRCEAGTGPNWRDSDTDDAAAYWIGVAEGEASAAALARRVEALEGVGRALLDRFDRWYGDRGLEMEELDRLRAALRAPAAEGPPPKCPCACGHDHLAGSDGEDDGCKVCDCTTWCAPAATPEGTRR